MISREETFRSLPKWMHTAADLPEQISDGRFHRLLSLAQLGEMLVLRAAKASTHSVSWRHFPVGCAVAGYRTSTDGFPTIFTGHNVKVQEDAHRTTCSEVIAVGGAIQAGCTHIPIMCVVGSPQEENVLTLRPCHRCQQEFRSLQILAPNTIIITATFAAVELLREDTERMCHIETVYDSHIRAHVQAYVENPDYKEEVTLSTLYQDKEVEVMSMRQLLSGQRST